MATYCQDRHVVVLRLQQVLWTLIAAWVPPAAAAQPALQQTGAAQYSAGEVITLDKGMKLVVTVHAPQGDRISYLGGQGTLEAGLEVILVFRNTGRERVDGFLMASAKADQTSVILIDSRGKKVTPRAMMLDREGSRGFRTVDASGGIAFTGGCIDNHPVGYENERGRFLGVGSQFCTKPNETDRFVFLFPQPERVSGPKVTIAVDHCLACPKGGVTVIADLDQLARPRGAPDVRFRPVFTAATSDLPDNDVNALAVAPDSALWIGTRAGLARYHQGQWQAFTAATSGLPDDYVYDLGVAPDGALWIGTSEGLARFHQGQWQVFTAATRSRRVQALALAPDGAVWIGTSEGLARFHQGQWQVFTAATSDLPYNDVNALAVAPDGALWIGTSEGLARFHQGQWQVFTAATSDLPHDRVHALAVAPDGALWIGTFGGLARFHQGQWHVFTAATSDLWNDLVIALTVAPDGALWIGGGSGLARFHQGEWQVFTAATSGLPDDNVDEFAVAPDGTLWIGTFRGLARYQSP